MTGFKNFILRGNLVELAVALIMALAFAAVVKATVDLVMGIIGKAGGHPDFSTFQPGGLLIGVWITAVIAFLITAAVVYYVIVVPYTKAKERYFPEEPEGTPADVALLTEIRDLLLEQRGGTTPTTL
jgi:large conductance mechanosensitive channel